MEEIKREIYEQDAIEEKMEEDYKLEMQSKGFVKCKLCDMWCEDTTNGICESCIDGILDTVTLVDAIEYASTLDRTYEDSELVFYTQHLFSRDEVIEILKREALKAYDLDSRVFDNEIKEFINTDTGHYLDYLENRGEI